MADMDNDPRRKTANYLIQCNGLLKKCISFLENAAMDGSVILSATQDLRNVNKLWEIASILRYHSDNIKDITRTFEKPIPTPGTKYFNITPEGDCVEVSREDFKGEFPSPEDDID